MPRTYRKGNKVKRRYRRRRGGAGAAIRRKKRLAMARSVNLRSNLHYFKRHLLTDNLSYTTDAFGQSSTQNFQMALNSLTNFSDFTDLFDQYKITKLVAKVRYSVGNVDDIGNIATAEFPILYGVPDKDDSGSINIQQVNEHSGRFIKRFGDYGRMTHYLTIPTQVKNTVDGIAFGSGSTPLRSPWIDTQDVNVPHGLLKIAVKGSPLTTYKFHIDWTVYLQCRSTR